MTTAGGPRNTTSQWRPLLGALALSVRILPDRIDVNLPRSSVEPRLPLTLGLFMQASLDLAVSDGATADSLSCTAAAVAWQCIDNVADSGLSTSVSLAKPEWRGMYVAMLVADSCSPLAVSAPFEAGPLAVASPCTHTSESPCTSDSAALRWHAARAALMKSSLHPAVSSGGRKATST
jgi:hypothetical protein